MPHVALQAVADINEPAAEASRRDFGALYHTTDPERVLQDPDVDAVIIATHHDSHAPLAVAAAASRKHILLEKPVALTVEECRSIRDAVMRAGVVCSVNFKFRFAPAVMRVRETVPQPILIVGQLAMERIPDGHWVRDPVRGGGLLLATACHAIDMVCHLSGADPVRVYAEGTPRPPRDGCDVDTAAATVRFGNGSVAVLAAADAGENPYTGKWLHQVFDGSRSAVLYDHFRQASFSGCSASHFVAEDDLRADGTYGLMDNFIDCIRSGRRPAVTVDDGLRATALAVQLLESISSSAPVQVDTRD
jgi:predicted dehydrogenase